MGTIELPPISVALLDCYEENSVNKQELQELKDHLKEIELDDRREIFLQRGEIKRAELMAVRRSKAVEFARVCIAHWRVWAA